MLSQIVDIQLQGLIALIQKEKGITVVIKDGVKELIAEHGRDPQFGARPLKRSIQNMITDELALMIIEGKLQEGDSLSLSEENNKISFQKEKK
jgi:ATP-dependent Clp protease ATP-binding subunit ClpA